MLPSQLDSTYRRSGRAYVDIRTDLLLLVVTRRSLFLFFPELLPLRRASIPVYSQEFRAAIDSRMEEGIGFGGLFVCLVLGKPGWLPHL